MQQGDPVRIGSFVVQGRLGQGAMGAVYLARSPGGRLVAVKVVREELAGDAGFRQRFWREVEAAKKVSGAFTAAVVDADPGADRPWLATEYLPGPTLQQSVDSQGPLTPAGVQSLAGGLAEALAAIHRSGLVHRDLKPSNIVLTDNGPRVIDFGIARALEDASLTATGMVIGTPGYLSPEQITGAAVGLPSDLFALGGVLVFAASGHGPFGTGTAAALTHRAVNEAPQLPFLPAPLNDVVRRCLGRRPADRPVAEEVLHILGSDSATAIQAPASNTLSLPSPVTRVLPEQPPQPQPMPGGPPPVASAGASFATTRVRPVTYAVIGILTAWIFAGWADTASAAARPTEALVTLALAVVGGMVALRNLLLVFRRRVRLQLTPAGVTVTRGQRTAGVPWVAVTRLRIMGRVQKPWLVAWFDASDNSAVPAPRRRHHGGYRIYPVGHELTPKRRFSQLAELQAALNWYAGRLHDNNY